MKSSLTVFTAGVLVAVAISAVKGYGIVPAGLARTLDAAPNAMVMGDVTPQPTQDDIQQIADGVQAASPDTAMPSSDQLSLPRDRSTRTAVPSSPLLRPTGRLAQAQSPDADPPTQPRLAPPQTPDETALRYFASRGDKVRLQAEISRLQALYPNWTPPADPLNIPQNGDKQLDSMWQLYSEGRYAEVRKAISDRKAAEAGWQPPADLIERLDVAEARARLVNASDLKQYGTVVDIAASTPSLLTCSEVDVLWRLAEAFVNTNRNDRGADAYGYILTNCTNPAERTATVQKASLHLSYGQMQSLLGLEKSAVNGVREFDPIRDELSRRFLAEANADSSLAIAPDYITRVETLARDQHKPADDLLLGWYQLRHKNEGEAEKWFRAALATEDSSSASQGLALALIARKDPQEAEDVMYKWRNDSKDATSTYLAATANLMAQQPPPDVSEDVLSRIASTVIEQKYVPTAQQLGWYARALNQPKTAAQWFQAALSWKPDDEPSAYGLVLTRALLNDRRGVADIQRSWSARSPRIRLKDGESRDHAYSVFVMGETVR